MGDRQLYYFVSLIIFTLLTKLHSNFTILDVVDCAFQVTKRILVGRLLRLQATQKTFTSYPAASRSLKRSPLSLSFQWGTWLSQLLTGKLPP